MTIKKQPNFLLVGAQKAGSTSLYYYLNEHPQIFMSPRKEPLYFTSEIAKTKNKDKWMKKVIKRKKGKKPYIDNFEDYLSLFKGVTNEIAIGEASAAYLYYYKTSIPNIKKKLGDVKILIILRNPLEKVFSQYKQLKKANAEPYSFEKALQNENERIKKNYNVLFHYTSQALYYEQVKAFTDNFSNVKIILLDDLKKDPQKTMNTIFKFLSVNDNYTIRNDKVYLKTDHIPKSQKIQTLLNQNSFIKTFRYKIKKLHPYLYNNLSKIYTKKNFYTPALTKKAKFILSETLYEDIIKLENFIERDLTNWKNSLKN